MRRYNLAGLFSIFGCLSLGLAACSHAPAKTQTTAAAFATPETFGTPAAQQPTAAAEPVVRGDVLSRIADLAPVHFDFDSDLITENNGAILRANADFLNAHEGVAVQVAGRCDQRGTVEYNLALGQRRADAVRRYYQALGISAARVATISYGKENLSCDEDTEACWSENREAQTLEATPTDISSVFSQWPEMAQLSARVMIGKYGPPPKISANLLQWDTVQPWKSISVSNDAAAPLEQTVAYNAPADKLGALYEFGHGLTVRADDGVMSARGDSEAHNLLTLNLANDIATGKMSRTQAERFYQKTLNLEVSGKSSSYTRRLQF